MKWNVQFVVFIFRPPFTINLSIHSLRDYSRSYDACMTVPANSKGLCYARASAHTQPMQNSPHTNIRGGRSTCGCTSPLGAFEGKVKVANSWTGVRRTTQQAATTMTRRGGAGEGDAG